MRLNLLSETLYSADPQDKVFFKNLLKVNVGLHKLSKEFVDFWDLWKDYSAGIKPEIIVSVNRLKFAVFKYKKYLEYLKKLAKFLENRTAKDVNNIGHKFDIENYNLLGSILLCTNDLLDWLSKDTNTQDLWDHYGVVYLFEDLLKYLSSYLAGARLGRRSVGVSISDYGVSEI